MTFTEVGKDYLKYASTRHKKQGYIIIYQNLNNYVLPYLKDKNIKSLTKLDVIKWQDIIISKN